MPHDHNHSHAHQPRNYNKAFGFGIALNVTYLIIEFAFGLIVKRIAFKVINNSLYVTIKNIYCAKPLTNFSEGRKFFLEKVIDL